MIQAQIGREKQYWRRKREAVASKTTPAFQMGGENQGRGENTVVQGEKRQVSYGDLQARGQMERLKSITWPHWGHRMLSRQDVAGHGFVVGWSGCSVSGSVLGAKLCWRAANRERRVAPKKP